MSKLIVEYSKERIFSPLSFWVHKATNSDVWVNATKFDLPLPPFIFKKGYPRYVVEYRGCMLYYSSREEIIHCNDILSKKSYHLQNS